MEIAISWGGKRLVLRITGGAEGAPAVQVLNDGKEFACGSLEGSDQISSPFRSLAPLTDEARVIYFLNVLHHAGAGGRLGRDVAPALGVRAQAIGHAWNRVKHVLEDREFKPDLVVQHRVDSRGRFWFLGPLGRCALEALTKSGEVSHAAAT